MFKRILFCADFSENSQYAFTYALNVAKNYSSELVILHVAPVIVHLDELSTYLPSETLEELKTLRRKDVDRQMETHYLQKMGDFKNSQVIIKEGQPFLEIIRTAKNEGVDLIVMGTHGRTGLDHMLLGSTAEKVVRQSTCPVLTIRLPGKKFTMA